MLRALQEGRRVDRLHQPQAERGARDLRPRDRAAARQADRHGADRGRDRAEPRAPDGRPRRAAAGGQGERQARRAGARGRGPPRARRARARGGEGRVADRARRRGGGARRRGRQRPARAGAGDRRACASPSPGAIAIGGRGRAGRGVRARPARPAWRTSPRTATCAAWCSTSRSRRTSLCASTASPPISNHGLLSLGQHERARQRRSSRSTTCAAASRARSRARCRAATSRRSAVAREIASNPKLLIAHQPTRGLDVGAIEFVHGRLLRERDEGPRHPAGLARVRGGPRAGGPHPRDLRGADRRRVPARRLRGGARRGDDRRRGGRAAA